MTYTEARKLVLDYLQKFENPAGVTIVIVDSETCDYDWCFVFDYESKEFLESNDDLYQIIGRSPILISKKTGIIIELRPDILSSEQVAELEKNGGV